MERHEYEVMFRLEEDYWWYLGLRDLVFRSLNRFIGQNMKQESGARSQESECGSNLFSEPWTSFQKSARLLDAGSGTGKLLEMCRNYQAYGLEFSEDAFPFLKMRGLRNVVRSSICDLPFQDQAFHGVVSLDVLYHAGVGNDEQALVEIHRVLKSGGLLILNLPAFEFLRSEHDLAVHTRRRYRTGELRQKLEKTGFMVQVITYRNTFLFPLAALVRLIKKATAEKGPGHTIKSDLSPLPSWANKLLYGILAFENALICRGVTFPFGLSVFCIAKKRG